MILEIFLIVVIIAAVILLGWLALRKLPQIRVVDPSSSQETKTKELKYSILKTRMERVSGEHLTNMKRNILVPLGSKIQDSFRRVAGKLTAIERRYSDKQKGGIVTAHNPEILRGLINESEVLIDEGHYDAAEKKLIEVVSHDPKNIPAYEHLGRLYLLNKDFVGARETFNFLLRLSPKDASVCAALGEVAEAEGKQDEALVSYKLALDISPNNPKYIDFYLDTVITTGDVHEATTTLDHLRAVNPDNAKIEEFEERIKELREKKKGG
jgi:Flp pilus assembly protein TadD